ncbi:MAG: zinc metallopeptidase [Bacteroidota bacterium]|nr:zinc metallopeptidase [Bacteroidota bacterium]
MIGLFILSFVVSARFKNRFKKYSEVALGAGLSGREIAERMLRDSGIHDVQVVSGQGMLSDHYNPLTKTVSLSMDVYNGRSIAAASVAAHECGHAVQHATAYAWLQLRSTLVPVVSFANNVTSIVLLIGVILYFTSQLPYVLLLGVLLLAATTLFSFITLPVEYDASNRALAWLNTTNLTTPGEHVMAKDALKWAARTYLVAALASLATLLYYASMLLGSRD